MANDYGQKIRPNKSDSIKIDTSKSKDLEEVLVVGYGAVKRQDLTGSISSIKGNELTKLPSQRLDQALQGQASGVRVQVTDGAAPGASTVVRIRGSNSLQGGNNALVVVDGVQGIDMSVINPDDIESVEILKDASATAIYGSLGANGVIIVTTKKGKVGKPRISYSLSQGKSALSKKIDLLSAGEYAENINEYKLAQNDGGITPVAAFTDAQVKQFYATGGIDWQDVIYRKANIQNHQLSIGGGSDNVKYYTSVGLTNQDGILKSSSY